MAKSSSRQEGQDAMTDHVHEWELQSDGRYWRYKYERMLGEFLTPKQVVTMLNEHGKLEAENERLREYAQHHYQCDWHKQPEQPCTCGLDALAEVSDAD